jgi:hypothetical protein
VVVPTNISPSRKDTSIFFAMNNMFFVKLLSFIIRRIAIEILHKENCLQFFKVLRVYDKIINSKKGIMKGKVYLVGAGPGDIGLLTIKGLKCLKKAEVVVYDFHLNAQVLNYANHEAELIYAGKRGGRHTMTQDEINAVLVQKAKEGKRICRLKGGDPFVFGRGGEEAEELSKEGIEFEVVPGVSSSIAAPAYAGIPLTHRL